MKKLSIIIPIHNTKLEYTEECLKSCPQNTETEIIVVDDDSELNYETILKKYKLKYIKTQNNGVSKARNIGIDLAEGEYITFLDSDDIFIPNEKILNSANNKDIIIARNYLLKEQTIKNYYQYNNSRQISIEELKKNMFLLNNRTIECVETVWSKFYRKDYLTKNNIIFNEKLKRGEDVLFNYEAYTKANNIFYCNEFTYNYRMTNKDSITRSFDRIMDIETFKLLKEFETLFKKLNTKEQYYPNYVFRLIVRLFRKYYTHLTKEEFNQKIDLLFSNVIIENYLKSINLTNEGAYKKQLQELIILKDKIKLYDYVQTICKTKLLKK